MFVPTPGRQVRPTALGRGTHAVSDVHRLVEDQFHVAFPHRVWVAGEVGPVLRDELEDLRFTLHASGDRGPDEVAFSLPCVVLGANVTAVAELLHRSHDALLDEVLREGRLARVGGLLRFDTERRGVVLLVSELDPAPTTAALADARTAARAAVVAQSLAEHQSRHPRPRAPLDVAVVGPAGDPELDRVCAQLTTGPFAVSARPVPARLTGTDAPQLLAQALTDAAQGSDAVLVVRSQGQPLGLAAFDALEAAQAVAASPVPVLTGLGGSGVVTACDDVAGYALPTAEAAGAHVLGWLDDAAGELSELREEVAGADGAATRRCHSALTDATASIELAAAEAQERSAQASAVLRRRLLVAAAAVVALVVGLVLATRSALPLLLLLLPVAVVVGQHLLTLGRRSAGRRRMAQRQDEFTAVVQQLEAVRDELTTTASPERVAVLREVAADLAEQGRQLLEGSVGPPPA
ncbi:hypothetical protein BH24ACT10_BH24ACT10_10070 [soil metagenome]